MVKRLDEDDPVLLDHVGWRLWRLASGWKAEFDTAMVKRGHAWFAEARSGLIGHLDREGTPQSELASRMRLTKQAVQQFVDELVAEGIVARHDNPRDGRSRIVRFTRKGLHALADANAVKQEIQARYASLLGPKRFEEFMASLEKLGAGKAPDAS